MEENKDQSQNDYLFWLDDTTNKYRGIFLSKAISVEHMLDTFLTYYFIGNDKNKDIQFREFFLDSKTLAFNHKIKAVKRIVDLLPIEFSHFKKFMPTLIDLMETRNLFAHSTIDNRTISIAKNTHIRDELHLLKLKNSIYQEIVLSINELDSKVVKFSFLILQMSELGSAYYHYKPEGSY